MTDMTAGQSAARVKSVQDAYMEMTRRKRTYGAVMLIVFIALMVSGFRVADGRNAGGFWDGIGNIFQFPGEVLSEAGQKIANLPGLMWKFLPSLIETVEGLQSVGATWGQRMWLGVIPQVAPNYLSYALLRFEINIRASAILGFVGSGGIGYDLKNAFSWGQGRYDEVAAIFLLLFGTIVFFDQMSSHFRNKLIGEG